MNLDLPFGLAPLHELFDDNTNGLTILTITDCYLLVLAHYSQYHVYTAIELVWRRQDQADKLKRTTDQADHLLLVSSTHIQVHCLHVTHKELV